MGHVAPVPPVPWPQPDLLPSPPRMRGRRTASGTFLMLSAPTYGAAFLMPIVSAGSSAVLSIASLPTLAATYVSTRI